MTRAENVEEFNAVTEVSQILLLLSIINVIESSPLLLDGTHKYSSNKVIG